MEHPSAHAHLQVVLIDHPGNGSALAHTGAIAYEEACPVAVGKDLFVLLAGSEHGHENQ